MSNPLFTIITVTYNSSKYVRDAIESVLASSYKNFEYIIGDDCSTDETWEIIQEYNDPRIIRYRNEQNLREYPNRNKAISMAKGEWILFIDGDDIIYAHALSVLFGIFRKESDFAIAVMCPENEHYIPPLKLNPKQLFEIEFSEYGLINRALSHTVYKSSILKNSPFEINDFIGLDTLNRLQILVQENCLLIPDNLTWWRRSENQASKMIDISLKNEMFLMSKKIFLDSKCPLTNNLKENYIKNCKVKLVRRLFRLLFKLNFAKAYQLFYVNEMYFSDLKYIFYRIKRNNPIHEINKGIRFSLK
jgi:glycosyltransferase involved in cell wall biosynthesis